jgi:hypothetical protein
MYMGTARAKIESDCHRSLPVFNFGEFRDESRQPFGKIAIVNDETLAANRTKSYELGNCAIVVVPMIGALVVLESGNEHELSTGELLSIDGRKPFSVQNPYDDQQVNYLLIGISDEFQNPKLSSVENKRNELQDAFEIGDTKGFLGIFDGREKGEFASAKAKGLFVFVINGAFEFDDRLLETRDSVAIWDAETHDFEALSGNAILLLIETPFV